MLQKVSVRRLQDVEESGFEGWDKRSARGLG
jgi:hypothetical protein